ncbi:MAG: sirohydrochlorin chelatase [Roseiflexaceae bacterium]
MRPRETQYRAIRPPPAAECGAPRRAVVLVGHGSLRPGAGAAMVRLAERARAAGVAPIVKAGFLNYSRPTFAEVLAQCLAEGAAEVVVQPYFLIPGKFVRQDLARLLEEARASHPGLALRLAPPFGDHPALARLLLKRAHAAADMVTPSLIAARRATRPLGDRDGSPDICPCTGLLIMAHGSPDPRSNAPIYQIARRVRASNHYTAVTVCFLDLNRPGIPEAIDTLAGYGIRRLIAAPFFLQLGNHVREDLPAIVDAAHARHPTLQISLAEHLAYDPLLVAVIADRVAEAQLQIIDSPRGHPIAD